MVRYEYLELVKIILYFEGFYFLFIYLFINSISNISLTIIKNNVNYPNNNIPNIKYNPYIFTIISYNLNPNINNSLKGYLKALGMARTAQVKRDARMGEAMAKKEAGIRVCYAIVLPLHNISIYSLNGNFVMIM